MMAKNYIVKALEENIELKKKLFDKKYTQKINYFVKKVYDTIKNKNKILICGNGGSAADAQHLSAEFLVRLNPKVNRKPYPVISLALDSSTMTACGNDFNFDKIFSRNLEALGKKGDILIVISTSGKSKNILNVLKQSKKMKITSLAFLGNDGGKAKNLSNYSIVIPSKNVARIQESHIFLGHVLLNEVEKKLLKR